MPQSSPLRLGTRGSKLALVQAHMVANLLAEKGAPCEIVTIISSGDRIQDRSLAEAGGKGLFVKELEEALLDGRIDFAVHSMKDLPAVLPVGLCLASCLPREVPFDALIMKAGKAAADLPATAVIGTSSVRRVAQLRRAYPRCQTVLLRGNVDTRLAKLDGGQLDATLLACAGLRRLGLESRITAMLTGDLWLPALAQGVVGLEARAGDACLPVLAKINDARALIEVSCERGFQLGLGGSCRSSIAGLARAEAGRLTFRGEVLAPDGSNFVETGFELPLSGVTEDDAAAAGERGRKAGLELRPRALVWL
jgi:hydroxymethylbilane synthase